MLLSLLPETVISDRIKKVVASPREALDYVTVKNGPATITAGVDNPFHKPSINEKLRVIGSLLARVWRQFPIIAVFECKEKRPDQLHVPFHCLLLQHRFRPVN